MPLKLMLLEIESMNVENHIFLDIIVKERRVSKIKETLHVLP